MVKSVGPASQRWADHTTEGQAHEDFLTAWQEWSEPFGLHRDPWILNHACCLLTAFLNNPDSTPSFAGVPLLSAHLRPAPGSKITPPGPYYPDTETRAEYETRIKEYADLVEDVGTFTWKGHTIANPFQDETGRFPVTPHHYGFEVTNTGGGCTAWVRDEAPGVELWVTDLDGDAATCDRRGWIIGLYYMTDDEQEWYWPIWCVTVGADGEQEIDIADPDPRPHEDAEVAGIHREEELENFPEAP